MSPHRKQGFTISILSEKGLSIETADVVLQPCQLQFSVDLASGGDLSIQIVFPSIGFHNQ